EMEVGVLTGKYASNKGGLAVMVKYIDGMPLGKDDPGIISVMKEGTTTVLGTNAHMKPIPAALVNVTILGDDGNNSINKPAPNVELGLVLMATNMGKLKARLLRF
nr:hypothetical protein [Tanacetum cinerariifolium]